MRYPPAPRGDDADVLHGRRVPDPYRWLEDPASPATGAWLAAQDALWRAQRLPARERFRERCAELAVTGTVGTPVWRGGRCFFLHREAGRRHPELRVVREDGTERAVLDPSWLDAEGAVTLDAWQPCPDGRLLAYQLSSGGTELADLYVLEVATGRVVDGPIDRCRYSPVAWLPGGGAFYYVRGNGPGDPGRRVLLHRVGDDPADDAMVFDGGTAAYGLGLDTDGRWLLVAAADGLAPRNDLWIADLAGGDPGAPAFRAVQEGRAARSVGAVARDGRLYLVTDDGAPHGRICVADPAEPGAWRELVPEDPGAVLANFALLDRPGGGHVLLVARLRDAAGELALHDPETGERAGEVPLPGAGTVGALSGRPEGGTEVWFSYTDTVTPESVWRHDLATGATVPWRAAPGTVPDVRTHRLVGTSADGTPVPMTLIGRPSDGGPRPTLLYGYGGFGAALGPRYAADALAWVEAGGVVAVARLRGDGERGAGAHRAGTRGGRERVVEDLAAAAEHLVAEGWTTADRLAVWGESNGGLLACAAVTRRPELFAAAVCLSPLADMVRYERSGLGPAWREEFGTVEDAGDFAALLAYSPYHRVRAGVDYPAVLLAAGGGDGRVDPLHARKMCAALQGATAGDRPVLLRHEEGVGHGARAADRALDLAADLLAFAAARTGLA
ncbi:prolyl oligopeptidase family serine peptidase [Actinomadura parmotrematis]|uniref:prolyl oligopeptidase n=1 Tax=Actinomadura parmotrematis TaxID=2864039 RepID=A0ABS7FTL0_9ACTN|nr:prolyl oligopeptidase family serine peptidase [Actinomadura parmotrematis]MBW8483712.1 prolyl oligopeptidase family serine peptidase [Actinomadura parmotrematis]